MSLHLWPVAREHCSAERIDLDLPYRMAQTGPLKAEL